MDATKGDPANLTEEVAINELNKIYECNKELTITNNKQNEEIIRALKEKENNGKKYKESVIDKNNQKFNIISKRLHNVKNLITILVIILVIISTLMIDFNMSINNNWIKGIIILLASVNALGIFPRLSVCNMVGYLLNPLINYLLKKIKKHLNDDVIEKISEYEKIHHINLR